MPTFSANKPSTSREAGFSLVELLAVLAIMSLMVGAVVMNLPEGESALDRRGVAMTERVQARLDAAALRGEMRALRLDEDGLTLLQDRGEILTPMDELPWPEEARVTVRINGDRVDLSEETPSLLWIEPYGSVPDLDIALRGRDGVQTLSFDDRGQFTRTASK